MSLIERVSEGTVFAFPESSVSRDSVASGLSAIAAGKRRAIESKGDKPDSWLSLGDAAFRVLDRIKVSK